MKLTVNNVICAWSRKDPVADTRTTVICENYYKLFYIFGDVDWEKTKMAKKVARRVKKAEEADYIPETYRMVYTDLNDQDRFGLWEETV